MISPSFFNFIIGLSLILIFLIFFEIHYRNFKPMVGSFIFETITGGGLRLKIGRFRYNGWVLINKVPLMTPQKNLIFFQKLDKLNLIYIIWSKVSLFLYIFSIMEFPLHFSIIYSTYYKVKSKITNNFQFLILSLQKYLLNHMNMLYQFKIWNNQFIKNREKNLQVR